MYERSHRVLPQGWTASSFSVAKRDAMFQLSCIRMRNEIYSRKPLTFSAYAAYNSFTDQHVVWYVAFREVPLTEVKKLGDMLKDAGLIDDFQLETALSHQRNWGGKLGAILIAHAFVREGDLSRVIAQKLHIPYINLFEPEVSPEVFKLQA